MSRTIQLPALDIAHRNFSSSCIGACNRRFAIFQVDVAQNPFWVVEIGPDDKPMGPAKCYSDHSDAILCISVMARNVLNGTEFHLPAWRRHTGEAA